MLLILNQLYRGLKIVTSALDYLTNHHAGLVTLMALGLGIGFGLTVFQQPTLSNAWLTKPTGIALTNLAQLSTPQASFEIAPDSNSNQINDRLLIPTQIQQTIFLTTTWSNYDYLKLISLGDKITLTHRNQTKQHYLVTDLKMISQENIYQITNLVDQQIIIYCPTNWLEIDYLAVIAKLRT